MKKKAIVVSAFYSERITSRPYIAEKYFKERNYDVKVICSDFSHSLKKEQKHKDKKNKYIIKTLRYKKNLSLMRILSHIKFALDAKKIIDKESVDIIYINLPPNILGYLLTKNKNCKVILDIIDLWPEALPIPIKVKKIFDVIFGKIWKNFRSLGIKKSDFVITHVEHFYDQIKLYEKDNSKVVYLCKDSAPAALKEINNSKIKIAYLGNISHIYDFDALIYIAKKIDAHVEIIGKGNKEEWLIKKLKKEGIDYFFHGVVYDEKKKKEILQKCDFGFNGYKQSTNVAMSYKSIDYFSYNLPIINSAQGDTWTIVEKDKVGINYDSLNIEKTIVQILNKSEDDLKEMKIKTKELFKNNFTFKRFKVELDNCIEKVI